MYNMRIYVKRGMDQTTTFPKRVERTYEFGIGQDNLFDTLSSKGLFPEPSLDVVQDLSMSRVRFVQDVLEREISWPKTIAEMLSKDPAAIYSRIRVMQLAGSENGIQA